jgi:neutral ceramidase
MYLTRETWRFPGFRERSSCLHCAVDESELEMIWRSGGFVNILVRCCAWSLILMSQWIHASPPAGSSFKVGAARVDITPILRRDLLLAGYEPRPATKIHDHIFARAIVLDNGSTRAALVAVELIAFTEPMWKAASQRITAETGISADHLIIDATHTHSAPFITGVGTPDTPVLAYTAQVEDAVVSAVKLAISKLQPARMGIGRGEANVNVNRDVLLPHGWWIGANSKGPSDKTVTVIKFVSTAGSPLALFINYSVHGTVMGPQNQQLTGDLPGETSRFVEDHYGSDMVALWTRGSAGDQNPRVMTWLTTRPERPEDFSVLQNVGQELGKEVVRVADSIGPARQAAKLTLWGEQRLLSCPGQRIIGEVRPGRVAEFKPTDPESFRLGVLKLNEIGIVIVGGEVTTPIWERLKQASPNKNLIMVDNANGTVSYIPDDAAYDRTTFEVMGSHFQKGCAEDAIVKNAVAMISRGN